MLGFAVFAMFFGAGNLIFPPYLGLETGDAWFFGFLGFSAVECVMTMLSLLAAFLCKNGLRGIADPLGKRLSALVVAVVALCMGPLVVVPRTGATMVELAVRPIFVGAPPWVGLRRVFHARGALMHPPDEARGHRGQGACARAPRFARGFDG